MALVLAIVVSNDITYFVLEYIILALPLLASWHWYQNGIKRCYSTSMMLQCYYYYQDCFGNYFGSGISVSNTVQCKHQFSLLLYQFYQCKEKKNTVSIDLNCNWYCCIHCYSLRICHSPCLGMYYNLSVVSTLTLISAFNRCVRIRNSLEMCLSRNLLVLTSKTIILDRETCLSATYGYCNFQHIN